MSKEIVKNEKLPNELSELINRSDIFNKISNRVSDNNESLMELKTFTETSLQKIADFMPVINEKTNVFGRTNSFTSNKLMTLQMLSRGSTMRTLRQCLSQIERKRAAIRESITNLKKEKLKAEKYLGDIEDYNEEISLLESQLEKLENNDSYVCDDIDINEKIRKIKKQIRKCKYSKELLQISLESIVSNTAESRVYLEGAFKEIASFQDAYQQILKNKNISED
jgi:septal ring factor EnvC (AmiA/AmiB activator)